MPGSYTPSAPYGTGTDDYRCFLLDPELERDAWLTGTQVLPGNPDVVHHVILLKVPPEQVAAVEAKDAAEEDEGRTCFGGTGLDRFQSVDDAAWIGAWAPGGKESVVKPGFGTRLAQGSRIVMQVHYNLLAGQEPDTSAAQLRLAPGERPYEVLSTMLLPAPVELPCARSTPSASSAVALPRWPTSGSASGPRATPPTRCTFPATRSRRRVRSSPAGARCRSP